MSKKRVYVKVRRDGQLFRENGKWWVSVADYPSFRVIDKWDHYEGKSVTVEFNPDDQFADIRN